MSKWEIERKWSWSPWEMFVKVSLPELKWAVACSTCPYFLALQCRAFTSLGRNSTQTVEAIKLLWENLANFSSMHSTRPRLQNQIYPIHISSGQREVHCFVQLMFPNYSNLFNTSHGEFSLSIPVTLLNHCIATNISATFQIDWKLGIGIWNSCLCSWFSLFPTLGCYPALGLYSAGESIIQQVCLFRWKL